MIKAKNILEKLTPYKVDKYQEPFYLKLDSNENIYGASKAVLKAISKIEKNDISLYPCYGKLIDKISEKYNLDSDSILLTNGCDEALNIVISAYLDSDSEILSFSPTFSMPALYSIANGGVVKYIDYDSEFIFDTEKLQKNITPKTKIIYIATPNNPTGELANVDDIKKLVVNNPDILFIVDCTYINYADNIDFIDYLKLIGYENIVVVKSFSKDFALAGLRLGFIAAKSNIIDNLKKISSPYNVNNIAQIAGIAALEDEKYFKKIKKLNSENRAILFEGLKNLGFKPYISQANFILCDFGEYCEFYYQKLKNNGILTRAFSTNSNLKNCLRITVPKKEDIKFILSLFEIKDLLVFDLDGVVFDVRESYRGAIKETFKHFSGCETTDSDIQQVKNLGNMNCDWDTTKYLLSKKGIDVDYKDIVKVFQSIFFEPDNKDKSKKYLIDREKLIIEKSIFEKLSKKYDLVVFSGRLIKEARYSLKKFGLDKIFNYFITMDNLDKSQLKPSPWGLEQIKIHCPYKTIKYLGDSVDDIKAGVGANVDTIGVVPLGASYNIMKQEFEKLGAKYVIKDIRKIVKFLNEVK